jgi:ABC-type Mn2+/Zn2+ transport system permease subunit
MALVGDALSHVALPGIALALFYGADPFYGVIVFLTAAAFLIFWLEGRAVFRRMRSSGSCLPPAWRWES